MLVADRRCCTKSGFCFICPIRGVGKHRMLHTLDRLGALHQTEAVPIDLRVPNSRGSTTRPTGSIPRAYIRRTSRRDPCAAIRFA
jgi:hypothetical protein